MPHLSPGSPLSYGSRQVLSQESTAVLREVREPLCSVRRAKDPEVIFHQDLALVPQLVCLAQCLPELSLCLLPETEI